MYPQSRTSQSLDRTLVRFVCTNLTRAFFFLPFVSGNRYLASQDYLKSPISLVESRLKQNKYDLHLYYSSSSSPSFCYPRSHFRDKRNGLLVIYYWNGAELKSMYDPNSNNALIMLDTAPWQIHIGWIRNWLMPRFSLLQVITGRRLLDPSYHLENQVTEPCIWFDSDDFRWLQS